MTLMIMKLVKDTIYHLSQFLMIMAILLETMEYLRYK
jgi:hypothetical protein